MARAQRLDLGLVLPDVAELVWGLVGFLILFAFVVWKVWPTLNSMLEERQQAIQGKLEEAEQIRTEAEELRRQYAEQLRDARNRADQIIEEARSDAEPARKSGRNERRRDQSRLTLGRVHPRSTSSAESRSQATLAMLPLLAERRLLDEKAVTELRDAYVFLRNLEHRLQYLDDEQTHALPEDAEAVERFAN